MACELCDSPGGDLIWHNALCRVVRVADPDYPGFCRVILNRHVKEMSDLPDDERQSLMQVVFSVEQALTLLMCPDKINLASLGNLVPHVHWHIIPRFRDDAHFPQPIWSAPARAGSRRTAPEIALLRNKLEELL